MKNSWKFLALALCLFSAGMFKAQAQTPSPTPAPSTAAVDATGITANFALGDVVAIDAGANQLRIKTKMGEITVLLSEATEYFRVPPGERTLEHRQPIKLADIQIGDRAMARGRVSDDRKTVPARQVIIMTKADIAQHQEHDREEWRRRGLVGTISSINAETKEITVSVRTREGMKPVIVAVGNNVQFRRYAPDSVRFDDAKPSTFAEIKVGDELRALGERSADGARFTPEEVVTGSFRRVDGTITAINAASGEITVKSLQNGQAYTIVVNQNSMLRRLPPEMAQRLVMMRQMQAAGGQPGGQQPQGARPAGPTPQGAGPGAANGGAPGAVGPGGMRPGGGGFDPQELFERLPAITIADLKQGDAIGVLSTVGAVPTRLTAIKLAAGIEPLLAAPQAPAQQGGRQSPGMSIPGLDSGIGLP